VKGRARGITRVPRPVQPRGPWRSDAIPSGGDGSRSQCPGALPRARSRAFAGPASGAAGRTRSLGVELRRCRAEGESRQGRSSAGAGRVWCRRGARVSLRRALAPLVSAACTGAVRDVPVGDRGARCGVSAQGRGWPFRRSANGACPASRAARHPVLLQLVRQGTGGGSRQGRRSLHAAARVPRVVLHCGARKRHPGHARWRALRRLSRGDSSTRSHGVLGAERGAPGFSAQRRPAPGQRAAVLLRLVLGGAAGYRTRAPESLARRAAAGGREVPRSGPRAGAARPCAAAPTSRSRRPAGPR